MDLNLGCLATKKLGWLRALRPTEFAAYAHTHTHTRARALAHTLYTQFLACRSWVSSVEAESIYKTVSRTRRMPDLIRTEARMSKLEQNAERI